MENSLSDPLENDITGVARAAIADSAFTCCALSIKSGKDYPYRVYLGKPDPAKPESLQRYALFDVASLTKPLATTLLALVALDRKSLRLEEAAATYLPNTPALGNGATIEDLLSHRSGLPAIPALELCFPDSRTVDREKAITRLRGIKPVSEPGRRVEYSCTGFLLLGLILERIGGERLSTLFHREIALPLGLGHKRPEAGKALFSPDANMKDDCVPTEFCAWRHRRIKGEVHDESSYCMGGDGGNAGLFADLEGVERLFAVYENGAGLIPERWVGEARRCRTEGMEQRRGLGLLLSGANWGNETYGHTGFVGTSMWRDPRASITGIALTNRVYHGREGTLPKIQRFRELFHASIAKTGGLNP